MARGMGLALKYFFAKKVTVCSFYLAIHTAWRLFEIGLATIFWSFFRAIKFIWQEALIWKARSIVYFNLFGIWYNAIVFNGMLLTVCADQLSFREGSLESSFPRRACPTSVSYWWRAVHCLQALWGGQSALPLPTSKHSFLCKKERCYCYHRFVQGESHCCNKQSLWHFRENIARLLSYLQP